MKNQLTSGNSAASPAVQTSARDDGLLTLKELAIKLKISLRTEPSSSPPLSPFPTFSRFDKLSPAA